MARAVAECTCKYCGKQFEKVAFRRNRAEADSFVVWAEHNIDQCPECYKSAQEAEAKKKFDTLKEYYNFPAIVGVSDKQKAYADTLRNRFVSNNTEMIARVKQMIDDSSDEIAKMADETGKTEDAIIREALKHHYGMLPAYIVLTSADAREIIDTLR